MPKLRQYNGKKWVEVAQDGRTPVKGVDYFDGKNGINGKDGSPDTPDQVVEKVNKAKKKITQSSIEGLDKTFAVINRSIREKGGGSGGGGMGNVQHESKSLTSASTSVTTNYKIAGNGYAIWAYYQGQLVVRGNHYTVASDLKTLNLTFTPQDGTFIDLVYIRT